MGGVDKVRRGEPAAEGAGLCLCNWKPELLKQSRSFGPMRTEPPLKAPSVALRGFGGRPVRQFLIVQGLFKKL